MIQFVENRKIFFTISICLMVLTLVLSLVMGVGFDIQFKGGSIVTYSFTGELDKNTFRAEIEKLVGDSVTIQEQSDIANPERINYVVSLSAAQGMDSGAQVALTEDLNTAFPGSNIRTVQSNNVDATIGREFFLKCMVAVAFACLLMVIYIALRFKNIGGWPAGLVSIVALLHDVILVYASFVILRIPLNENFIAVILTILGYSINATIIIYDRIRENKRLYANKKALPELVNLSINQSLARTINTTRTTLIALACITVIAIASNVQSILSFSIPLMVGMVSGVYSSVCLTGPLWVQWKLSSAAKKKRA